jgi:DNA polymerase-3 subunit beta
MEVKIKKGALQSVVELLETITPAKSVVPILQNIKITASKNALTLYATDLEVGLQQTIKNEIEIIKEGEILLPAKKLADTLAQLDDEEIILKEEEGNYLIKPTYKGDWYYKFLGIDATSYPQFPKIEKGATSIELGLVDFKEMVNKTSFSVSDGISNYALSGILWEAKEGEFRMVSTDGVRLSLVKKIIVGEKVKPFKEIVPVKAVKILEKIADKEKTFHIYFDETSMQIKLSKGVFFTRLIEGTFPDYEEVIPQNYQKKISVPLQQFVSRLKTVLVFTSERAKSVKLILKKGSLKLHTSSSDTGEAFTKEIPVEYTGEDFSIILNPDYLADVCRVITDNNIQMEFQDATSPVLIRDSKDYIHLIMPISTQ